jgi:acyl carrier protein
MLCGLFAELLDIPEVGIHDSFFDLGGHSLLAARLVFRLREVLDADVPVGLVLSHPSVAELAEALDAEQSLEPREAPAERLERLLAGVREDDQVATLIAAMAPGVVPDRSNTARRDGHMLPTGVTGFFGAFLLDELLAQTDAHVSCLVRASDEDHAQSRIQASLERFGRWTFPLHLNRRRTGGDVGNGYVVLFAGADRGCSRVSRDNEDSSARVADLQRGIYVVSPGPSPRRPILWPQRS